MGCVVCRGVGWDEVRLEDSYPRDRGCNAALWGGARLVLGWCWVSLSSLAMVSLARSGLFEGVSPERLGLC